MLPSFGARGQSQNDFLPPDQAFRVEATLRDPTSAIVRFTPAEGYYLYKDKLAFRVDSPASRVPARSNCPRRSRSRPHFRARPRSITYPSTPWSPSSTIGGGIHSAMLSVDYQGCADQGLCYAPMSKTFNLDRRRSRAAAVAPAYGGGRRVRRTAASRARSGRWTLGSGRGVPGLRVASRIHALCVSA